MRISLPRADINVTPMIDVMLVLLIIFMVVVPVIASLVDLPIAENSDPRPPDEEGEITLYIERSGALVLETGAGESTRWDDFRDQLAALYTTRTRDRILYLKADSAVEFGVVERAMDMARDAGVRVVAAVTERRVTPVM
ncbi:MAG: ExbD/TolR family protein [Gemmatimonadales bacterium]